MENEKNGIKEDLALRGLDISKTTLEDSYCQDMQKHILQETDFDSSEDESEESDCTVIQRMLMLEMDCSFYSDGGHDSSSTSTSNVKRTMCERCSRFHYAEYKRARIRSARLSLDKTPGQHLDCEDSTLPLLRECCIEYYERWL